MTNQEKRRMSHKNGKQVKQATRGIIRPIEARQNALEARLDAIAAKVEGDGPQPSGEGVPSEGERRYAEWRKKVQADLAKSETDEKNATPLTAATIVSSGTATAEPVYVRSGYSRTVEMTPYGVAIITEKEQVIDDDTPLEPAVGTEAHIRACADWLAAFNREQEFTGVVYVPCDHPRIAAVWHRIPGSPFGVMRSTDGGYLLTPYCCYEPVVATYNPSDPTTPATSPTPIPVPVPLGRLAMVRTLLTSAGYITGGAFALIGLVAVGTMIGVRNGTVELTQVIEAGTVLSGLLEWVLGSTVMIHAGNTARVVLPWVIATRRASAARLSTLEEQLAKLSEQLAK